MVTPIATINPFSKTLDNRDCVTLDKLPDGHKLVSLCNLVTTVTAFGQLIIRDSVTQV